MINAMPSYLYLSDSTTNYVDKRMKGKDKSWTSVSTTTLWINELKIFKMRIHAYRVILT